MRKSVRVQIAGLVILSVAVAVNSQWLDSSSPGNKKSDTQTDTVKTKNLRLQWMKKISNETALLKLSENRAVANARLGNLYWKLDQSRARALFNKAADELIIAQREIENDPQYPYYPGFSIYAVTNARRQVLQVIVKNDQNLGFDLFIKSRPQLISDALAQRPLPDLGRIGFPSDDTTPAQGFIRQENELEQILAILSLSANQQKAIEILRRDSPDIITNNTFPLLKALRRKNPAIADEIAGQFVRRIFTIDLAQYPNSFRFINQLLAESLPENKSPETIQIDAEDLQRLAEKEANFLISSSCKNVGNAYDFALTGKSVLIKLLPNRASELNEITITPRSGVTSFSYTLDKDVQELIKNGTIEQIAARAELFPLPMRDSFYSMVANRIAVTGDLNRAKELLAKKFSGQRLADLYNSLYLAYAHQAIEKGDLEKAAELVSEIDPRSQYLVLTDIAIAINKKTPQDKQKALSYLDRAKQSLSSNPVTREDFARLDKIASAYALIEPKTGFQMLKTLIKKYVEIGTASIVVDSFQAQSFSARKNELLFGSNNLRSLALSVSLKNFMSSNPKQTQKLIEQIKRDDLRINFELAALESAENINPIF